MLHPSNIYGQDVVLRRIGVITSGYVTKMAVTPFDQSWPKIPVIRKLHGFSFYRTEVISDWLFTLRELGISRFSRKK